MKLTHVFIGATLAAALSSTAFAQGNNASNNAQDVQRDVNQQQRIEQGLQSGQLNTREAGKLENDERHVDKLEQRADRNGSISPAEQARINAAQNNASRDIEAQKHDAQTGNPESRSSQRLQSDVQRNVNQQQRTENGIRNGTLTNREVGAAERGQAHVNRKEASAAANGRVNAREQARVQRTERRQSNHISREKHNGRDRG